MSIPQEWHEPPSCSSRTLLPRRSDTGIDGPPLFSFGVISDIQLAKVSWRYNAKPRTAVKHLENAGDSFARTEQTSQQEMPPAENIGIVQRLLGVNVKYEIMIGINIAKADKLGSNIAAAIGEYSDLACRCGKS